MRINVSLHGYTAIDFDRKPVRKALMKEGREIRKLARERITKAALSAPGQFPGKVSGNTARSIAVFAQRGGFGVVIAPRRTGQEKKKFFPTILIYGSAHVQPRKDYIKDALESRRAQATFSIAAALRDSLKVR